MRKPPKKDWASIESRKPAKLDEFTERVYRAIAEGQGLINADKAHDPSNPCESKPDKSSEPVVIDFGCIQMRWYPSI